MDPADGESEHSPAFDRLPDVRRPPSSSERAMALLEVLICSGFPTQLALGSTLTAFGFGPFYNGGQLTLGYVAALSLIDTVFLLALILLFLHTHGEQPHELFLGHRPVRAEAFAGVPLIFAALGIAVAVLVLVQQLAPSLHNVAENPLQGLVSSPSDAVLFSIVVVVAGGVREELQRAFLLHRFEQWLGGAAVGVIVASAAFGAGHAAQGWDAALATGALGAFWSIVYLRRRSVIAPVVSHSGFNLLQLGQLITFGL